MALESADEVKALVNDELWKLYVSERDRLERIDKWYRWKQEDIQVPRDATPEHRALLELAKNPWLYLVVGTVAQNLYVDGYRTPGSSDNSGPWAAWQRNDMDARQVALHRAVLAYGYAYTTVLPGVDMTGEPGAVIRGVSPRNMQAVYEDPAEDDFPVYAIRVDSQRGGRLIRVYDEEQVWRFRSDAYASDMKFEGVEAHGVGVVPVVRYTNMLDLDGRAVGEVEPFIPLVQRINKTVYDRMMTQHHNSWKVRTIAGLIKPDNQEDAEKIKLQLRQDDLLVAEDPDTKFGTLPETPLDGFIRAAETDVKSLAAMTQTPTHALTGDMINLSAEALAAARNELDQKVMERKVGLGKAHDQTLRLSAYIEGDMESAADYEAHVTWQDTSVRSFSQAADALGKLAQMLGVPVRALWPRIPGVTKLDVDEWENLATEEEAMRQLDRLLTTEGAPEDGNNPAGAEPNA